MSRLPQLYSWLATLTSAFPLLSAAQVRGLAWFSFGMVLARSCSVTRVAAQLADLLGQQFDTVKQRLRDWYCEASAKAGTQRRQLDVRSCFAPLLRWVLSGWPSDRLALALDATSLSDRFVTLAVSVLYRGCAVPVAWKILPAGVKHSWRAEWCALLQEVGRALPRGRTVIVLSDRGLYAKWLYRAIQKQGWHPFMRINTGGTFRPEGAARRQPLTALVPQVGSAWRGAGEAFKDAGKRLRCTLLARWDAGYTDPWLVVTDLAAAGAEVCWYGLRAWIEQGFKRLKSGGWDWQKTHMSDPQRAERLWLVMATATWWSLLVGGEAEESDLPVATVPPLPAEPPAAAAVAAAPRVRLVSVFERGRLAIVNRLLRDQVLVLGRALPEPWPTQAPAARARASPAA
jgi:hypothetical protein